jgi:hypothetical protein
VRHGNEPTSARRTRRTQSSGIQENFASPWVYSVVTILHKDVFKRPIRVDWAVHTKDHEAHAVRSNVLPMGF